MKIIKLIPFVLLVVGTLGLLINEFVNIKICTFCCIVPVFALLNLLGLIGLILMHKKPPHSICCQADLNSKKTKK